MGVHMKGGMMKHAASNLGCLTLNTSFYYLGAKVGGSMSRKQAWKEVIDKEVKRAVWDCGTDKSLGPDGFTFGFYRQFWLNIENDVFEVVSHFFTHADIPKGCNPSFIDLISKIPDANKVNDFRPISLIGSIYKIITKILANRLVRVSGDIVNEVQSAFIAERQILDGPFILNEVLQWCKIKKKQSLIFKVDFEKAYDLVRWDFLDVLKSSNLGINGAIGFRLV
nr:cysteine-rich receptor-like protein kinase [Tanacetum cinerariifolium]